VGLALQPEEEALRSQLEALQNQLNAPAQFKVEYTMKHMSNMLEI
jgi:protoheme ferro-lyase